MIRTGKEPLPVMTYLAIMSVCFVINLPGIAITPMEGRLKSILHAPELEVQLLTTLPNFVIIPFVLLTGKLSLSRHKLPWVVGALILYLLCGLGYLFFESVTGLIVVSCLLGCANGILIPFAMGFVVNTFYGKYRTFNLGIKSATSNLGVVFGSFIVGILIEGHNWHLPFVVYLAVVIPLALCYWLRKVPGMIEEPEKSGTSTNSPEFVGKIDMPRVWGLIGNNVWLSFMTMAVVIYLPQVIQGYGWNPRTAGDLGALFFIFVLFAGFLLLPFVKHMKQYAFPGIGLLSLAGLTFITFIPEAWAMYVGSALTGIAFGIFQPLVYDKTSYTVSSPKKAILALSYVLTALYLAIAVEPFIITGICRLFHISDENHFVFYLSFFMAIGYCVCSFIWRHKFAFSIEKDLVSETSDSM